MTDKQSGKNLERPGYQALKGPLSRNKQEMKGELQWFKDHGIHLQVIDLPTTMIRLGEGQEWIRDMVNNILIEVLSSIAEEERRTIRQRQREGIAAARVQGKRFGRPEKEYPEDWEIYYARYKQGELTRKYIVQQMGVSVERFKYLARKYEKGQVDMDIEKAVDKAIDDMPDYEIRLFLVGHRAEVKDMCITEYNEAETMQMIREESREEGENKLGSLISILFSKGRVEDVQKVATDKTARSALYKEFNIV